MEKSSYFRPEAVHPKFRGWKMEDKMSSFPAGSSVPHVSRLIYWQVHISGQKLCGLKAGKKSIWHYTIPESYTLFRKMYLHILIRQGCQKHRENCHRKSHLISTSNKTQMDLSMKRERDTNPETNGYLWGFGCGCCQIE